MIFHTIIWLSCKNKCKVEISETTRTVSRLYAVYNLNAHSSPVIGFGEEQVDEKTYNHNLSSHVRRPQAAPLVRNGHSVQEAARGIKGSGAGRPSAFSQVQAPINHTYQEAFVGSLFFRFINLRETGSGAHIGHRLLRRLVYVCPAKYCADKVLRLLPCQLREHRP